MKKIAIMLTVTGLVLGSALAASAAGKKMTCGQMTAKFAAQPAALAELLNAAAAHFEAHATIVGEKKTKASAIETEGLGKIIGHLRAAAGELDKAAAEMQAATKWPDTPHDMAKIRSDENAVAAKNAKIAALDKAAAELQKEIDFWKSVSAKQK